MFLIDVPVSLPELPIIGPIPPSSSTQRSKGTELGSQTPASEVSGLTDASLFMVEQGLNVFVCDLRCVKASRRPASTASACLFLTGCWCSSSGTTLQVGDLNEQIRGFIWGRTTALLLVPHPSAFPHTRTDPIPACVSFYSCMRR